MFAKKEREKEGRREKIGRRAESERKVTRRNH